MFLKVKDRKFIQGFQLSSKYFEDFEDTWSLDHNPAYTRRHQRYIEANPGRDKYQARNNKPRYLCE